MNIGATFRTVFLGALLGSAASPAWAGTVKTDVYGTTRDGATVHVFTMTNNHGLSARVLDYGGVVCAVEAPGRDGKMANVILCQKDFKGIEATGPMSALTGRYANRLLHGFTLDGKHYDLQANPAGVTLHGGQPGYSRRILQTVETFQHANDAGVTLRLVSPDGDQGFPGAMTIDVTYTLTDNNDFRMEYKATTDKPTVVNLTNHTYYNLAGYGSVEGQAMTIMADQVTPTDVNQVPTGEMAFITGHSGAGKSTLLKLLGLIERPSHGVITLDGKNLGKMPRRGIPKWRRQIGMVFQDHRLLMERSVFANVELPLVIGGIARAERGRRVRAALEKVGLLAYERQLPATLSTGEQQRVGIARAIVARPTLLIADEPTGNLDPQLAVEVMGLFGEFQQVGTTVLVASHDLPLIKRMKKRVIVLDHGRLVADLSAQEVL